MKRSTIVVVGILLTMTMAWAAFGQAGGGGKGKGRGGAGGAGGGGGFGMMGEAQQKAVADLQAQVAKLKALVDAGVKAMAGGFQNMSEEDRAKMKEQRTEQQKVVEAIQADVNQFRLRQMAAEYTALKDAQASAEKEKAQETAQKLGQIVKEREKQLQDTATAMGMTMDQVEKMGQRRGGRGQ